MKKLLRDTVDSIINEDVKKAEKLFAQYLEEKVASLLTESDKADKPEDCEDEELEDGDEEDEEVAEKDKKKGRKKGTDC